MTTMQTVRNKFGGNICRRCFNKAYGLKLRSTDCLYDNFPSICPRCGTRQNIVIRLRLQKRLLLLLK